MDAARRSEDCREKTLYNLIWRKKVYRALCCILGTNKLYTEACLQLRFVANYKQRTLSNQQDSQHWYLLCLPGETAGYCWPWISECNHHLPLPRLTWRWQSDCYSVHTGLTCWQTKHKTQHWTLNTRKGRLCFPDGGAGILIVNI